MSTLQIDCWDSRDGIIGINIFRAAVAAWLDASTEVEMVSV